VEQGSQLKTVGERPAPAGHCQEEFEVRITARFVALHRSDEDAVGTGFRVDRCRDPGQPGGLGTRSPVRDRRWQTAARARSLDPCRIADEAQSCPIVADPFIETPRHGVGVRVERLTMQCMPHVAFVGPPRRGDGNPGSENKPCNPKRRGEAMRHRTEVDSLRRVRRVHVVIGLGQFVTHR